MQKVRYQTYAPPHSLAAFVKCFWFFEIEGISGNPYVYRSMADGLAEMVFHYRGKFTEIEPNTNLSQSIAMLHAQSGKFRRFVTFEDFGILGVCFYPFAIPALFGFSANDLTDEMPDLEALALKDSDTMTYQILESNSNLKRLQILTNFLENRRLKSKSIEPNTIKMIDLMLKAKGNISISKLADEANTSLRTLERKFKTFAGFNPKKMARILRFQAALEYYGAQLPEMSQLALDCGYYDQAHFNHDFRLFSGYSPLSYFQGNPEGSEYKST